MFAELETTNMSAVLDPYFQLMDGPNSYAGSSPPIFAPALDPRALLLDGSGEGGSGSVVKSEELEQPTLARYETRSRKGQAARAAKAKPPVSPSTSSRPSTSSPPPPQSTRSRRRNKIQNSSSSSSQDQDSALAPAPAPAPDPRQALLERNRSAAIRCRQKRKAAIADLQQRSVVTSQQHASLRSEASELRSEVLALRGLLLQHAGCGVDFIEAYINRSAQSYVTAPKEGPFLGPGLSRSASNIVSLRSDGSANDVY